MAALTGNQSVEVVEAIWKIPNFLGQPTAFFSGLIPDFRKRFFIGGRARSVDPQILSSLPIKIETWLNQMWDDPNQNCHFDFVASFDRSQLPSDFTVTGKLLGLKMLSCQNRLKDVNWDRSTPMDFRKKSFHRIKLFIRSDAENYVDKEDGALKIYFKLEVTIFTPNRTTKNNVTGDCMGFLNDFESLLSDSKNADVEIKVSHGGEKSFRCHKAILAARSGVFRAMFSNDMKEANKNVVEVDDISPKTMEHFLSFIYCGGFQDSAWIRVQPLLQLAYAANKYRVTSLKKICDSNLILCVTFKNALALGKLAEQHELVLALKQIRKFVAENAEEIIFDSEVDATAFDENFKVIYSYSTPKASGGSQKDNSGT